MLNNPIYIQSMMFNNPYQQQSNPYQQVPPFFQQQPVYQSPYMGEQLLNTKPELYPNVPEEK